MKKITNKQRLINSEIRFAITEGRLPITVTDELWRDAAIRTLVWRHADKACKCVSVRFLGVTSDNLGQWIIDLR